MIPVNTKITFFKSRLKFNFSQIRCLPRISKTKAAKLYYTKRKQFKSKNELIQTITNGLDQRKLADLTTEQLEAVTASIAKVVDEVHQKLIDNYWFINKLKCAQKHRKKIRCFQIQQRGNQKCRYEFCIRNKALTSGYETSLQLEFPTKFFIDYFWDFIGRYHHLPHEEAILIKELFVSLRYSDLSSEHQRPTQT